MLLQKNAFVTGSYFYLLIDLCWDFFNVDISPYVPHVLITVGSLLYDSLIVSFRFNNDPSIDMLLLTTHVGGLGLNVTGADTVIFVEHDWNPTKDLQVSVVS